MQFARYREQHSISGRAADHNCAAHLATLLPHGRHPVIIVYRTCSALSVRPENAEPPAIGSGIIAKRLLGLSIKYGA
jgi:hypothetical protein